MNMYEETQEQLKKALELNWKLKVMLDIIHKISKDDNRDT